MFCEKIFRVTEIFFHREKDFWPKIFFTRRICRTRWLTERYLQHNPNVTSGRDNVVQYFAGKPRAATCDKLTMPIVTVLTSGDIVGVVFRMQYDDPRNEGMKYTSIWYDQWRIVDGRADEHWDTATLGPPVTAQ